MRLNTNGGPGMLFFRGFLKMQFVPLAQNGLENVNLKLCGGNTSK